MNKVWHRLLVLTAAMIFTSHTSASLLSFEYSIGGFSGGGSVSGMFTGRDLNGDGYISSFVYSQDVDFSSPDTPMGLATGLNEVVSATANFQGIFEGGPSGIPGVGDYGTINSFSVGHDLTDNSQSMFGGPDDLFFVLNYKIGSGTLGDELFEGALFGTTDQAFVFGVGPFIPLPDGATSFPRMGSSPGSLPGGSSLTSSAILEASGGTPCVNGLTCGIVHTVGFDVDGALIAGSDLTSGLMSVNQIPEGPVMPLILAALCAMFVVNLNRQSHLS